ncbi:MAG: hypothetical protein GXP49_11005 [Deltaproteobacteria bacterium]|nr:hypothetical protein [Deltaproteobacteria bacterium]
MSRLLYGLPAGEAALLLVVFGVLGERDNSLFDRYLGLEQKARLIRRADVLLEIGSAKRARFAVSELKLLLAAECRVLKPEQAGPNQEMDGETDEELFSSLALSGNALPSGLAADLARLNNWILVKQHG